MTLKRLRVVDELNELTAHLCHQKLFASTSPICVRYLTFELKSYFDATIFDKLIYYVEKLRSSCQQLFGYFRRFSAKY